MIQYERQAIEIFEQEKIEFVIILDNMQLFRAKRIYRKTVMNACIQEQFFL